MTITTRPCPSRARLTLEQAGIHPLLARLYAARGISQPEALDTDLSRLPSPTQMRGAEAAASLLAEAIAARQKLLIIADYDCDGATACAVGIRALRALGASHVDYLVPNRFETGYGLSPEVVRLAALRQPDVLITVDNGISSVDGVAEAHRLGMRCLITDHHLPGAQLPDAAVIVNPNQPGCTFPSKALAGVGVIFYVMLALRQELRRRAALPAQAEPNLAQLLDLVALGTVADVVPLDALNRLLVYHGLARIRAGKAKAGIRALLRIAGRNAVGANTFDLGFAAGPRVNAAGRLGDMSVGIEALITDDEAHALNLAQTLDNTNRERRTREEAMRVQAHALADAMPRDDRASLVLFDESWHEGIVGLIAGRLRERYFRPVFAFAPGQSGEIKGSGRSIPGLHLRDALDWVSKQHPGMIRRFGGHAAAAGLTLARADLNAFTAAFESVAGAWLTPAQLQRVTETDGSLENGYCALAQAQLLADAVWGQAFPPPLFSDEFTVERQTLLKGKHLKLILSKGGQRFAAIRFNDPAPLPTRIRCAYRLDINEFRGQQSVQLHIEAVEPITAEST